VTDHREHLRSLPPHLLAEIDQLTAQGADLIRELADQAAVDGPTCCGGPVCVGDAVGLRLLPYAYPPTQALAFICTAIRLLGDERRRNREEAA